MRLRFASFLLFVAATAPTAAAQDRLSGDWYGYWSRVRVPILLIYGAADQRVPAAESAARIAATVLRHHPDAAVTVRIFPRADHTFRLPPGPSGWPVTAPGYISTLLAWLSAR